VILAKELIYISMEKNIDFRNRATYIQINTSTKVIAAKILKNK
jgi:hypothetical protein